jgi:peptide-methionine (S)-S-oxide reductase
MMQNTPPKNWRYALLGLILGIPLLLWTAVGGFRTTTATANIPTAAVDIPAATSSVASLAAKPGTQTAVLAGGCFWGVEAVFDHVKGVSEVVSGYSGGAAKTAQYERVSTGQTGHAEAVKITYDPTQISYGQLLKVYFSVAHDPTQVNRQGPDTGTQYRSAIFFTSPDQQKVAQSYITQLNQAQVFAAPIATELVPLNDFYAAEDYHQKFIAHNPAYPYVVVHDLPKLANLKKQFPDLYKS